MKFNVSSKVLMDHLSVFAKVINAKNTITILENFLFDLQGDTLTITGSDSESTLKTNIQVENAEGSGKVAIKVKTIMGILKLMPEQGLQFDIDEGSFEVFIYYVNGGQYNFMGFDGNEFPQKNFNFEDSVKFTMDGAAVLKGLDNTTYAVATEDARPVMMGVLWAVQPEKVVFVSSDTHMLVKYTNENVKSGITKAFILPLKPATILQTILQKVDGEVSIEADQNSATFNVGEYSLNCRFVNGRYPNYNAVIPAENKYSVAIDRTALSGAIRRMGILASASCLVLLDLRTNEILLSSQDVDVRTKSKETVPCNYVDTPMTVGYNHIKLTQLLESLSCDNLFLRLNGPKSPGVFESENEDPGEKLLVLLMPMMA